MKGRIGEMWSLLVLHVMTRSSKDQKVEVHQSCGFAPVKEVNVLFAASLTQIGSEREPKVSLVYIYMCEL